MTADIRPDARPDSNPKVLRPSASLTRAGTQPSVATRQRTLWALSLLHLAAGATLVPLLSGREAPVDGLALPPFPLVLAGIIALELAVVHVHLGTQAHTFSLGEIGLVVALFVLPPQQVLLAHLLASALTLVVHRKQSPLKTVYNLTHLALSITIAALAFHLLIDAGEPAQGARGWVAAVVAVLVSTVISDVAVTAAVAISDWRRPASSTLRIVSFSQVTALAAGTIGFIAVRGFSDPVLLGLVVVPTGLLYAAARGWVAVREQGRRVAFLAEVGQLLARTSGGDEAVSRLLTTLRETLRSRLAALVVLPDQEEDPIVQRVAVAEFSDAPATPVDTVDIPDVARLAAGPLPGLGRRAPRWPRERSRNLSLDEWTQRAGLKDLAAVPVDGEDGRIGLLLVADRLGDLDSFRQADLQLLESVATHLSAGLERGHLRRSVRRLEAEGEHLRHQTLHDALTGLANRALFVEHLDRALAQRNQRVGVLFVDLDDFKEVNDTLGHAAGDALLVEVSRRLNHCLRAGDTAARISGDEFAVLMPDAGGERDVRDLAARLLQTIAEPLQLAGRTIRLTASIGLAMGSGGRPEMLLARADAAMYRAKHGGKARTADAFGTTGPSQVQTGA